MLEGGPGVMDRDSIMLSVARYTFHLPSAFRKAWRQDASITACPSRVSSICLTCSTFCGCYIHRFPHGLWATTMDRLLDFVRDNGFNAIRLPVSLELALNLDQRPGNGMNDPTLQGLTSVRVPIAQCLVPRHHPPSLTLPQVI